MFGTPSVQKFFLKEYQKAQSQFKSITTKTFIYDVITNFRLLSENLSRTVLMIGVYIRTFDKYAVEEFFQLFKTPWEVFVSGSECEVVISDQDDAINIDASLVIILQDEFAISSNSSLSRTYQDSAGLLLEANEVRFPVYCGVMEVCGGTECVRVCESGATTGARFIDGRKTILRLGFNLFEEINYLLTNDQPLKYAHYPTLDTHIDNLRKWIQLAGIPFVEIPPVQKGHKFIACLTHDVDFAGIRNHKCDYTMVGFLYRAVIVSAIRFFKGQFPLKLLLRNLMAAISLPFVHLGLMKDFWYLFRECTQIESGCGSTFFLVPFKDTPGRTTDGLAPRMRSVKYEVAELKSEIDYLLEHGCEVGVHGIDSWIDPEKGKEEIKKIKGLTGCRGLGVRMHWLYFGPESPAAIEEAGYAYDSTCGYNETIGYRAGTLQVFRPPKARHLLELPMHIMDTALYYPDRMNLPLSEGLRWIREFAQRAAASGGVLTFNWHHRSIGPERLWGDVYREALSELRAQGARLSTAGSVVDWFRKRRAFGFEEITMGAASIRVKLSSVDTCLPDDFVLRLYLPEQAAVQGQANLKPSAGYRDYPLNGRTEIEVSL
jgi:hypothetical protein